MCHCAQLNSAGLIIRMQDELPEAVRVQVEPLLQRRVQGEPVAYLCGCKEFYGYDFTVTPDVLIPRPETEHIIELVEERYASNSTFTFADFGTGSGILPVTLCLVFSKATGRAFDISRDALAVASGNAQRHSVSDRIQFVRGDMQSVLLQPASVDLVVSNPPYVTLQEYADASHEVTAYEPQLALTSGEDGLDLIREFIPQAGACLKSGGWFFMEFGWQQGAAILNLALESGLFEECFIQKDLAGHDRILAAKRK